MIHTTSCKRRNLCESLHTEGADDTNEGANFRFYQLDDLMATPRKLKVLHITIKWNESV